MKYIITIFNRFISWIRGNLGKELANIKDVRHQVLYDINSLELLGSDFIGKIKAEIAGNTISTDTLFFLKHIVIPHIQEIEKYKEMSPSQIIDLISKDIDLKKIINEIIDSKLK